MNIIVVVGPMPEAIKFLPKAVKVVSITAEQMAAVEIVKGVSADVRAALIGPAAFPAKRKDKCVRMPIVPETHACETLV